MHRANVSELDLKMKQKQNVFSLKHMKVGFSHENFSRYNWSAKHILAKLHVRHTHGI